MKTTKIIPAFSKILGFVAVLVFFAACDKMNVNPQNYSNSVEGSFSASPDQIHLGTDEKATLSWSISDPDAQIETINMTGGGEDGLKDLTGTLTVQPTVTTLYYIDVLDKDGTYLRSMTAKVIVLDENENEVTTSTGEVPGEADVETLCEDGLDNDEDGFFDCLDLDDCAAAENCAVEEVPVAASFTTAPAFTDDQEFICIGDQINVTWVSDFAGVQVSDSSGGEKYFVDAEAITGNYTITLTDAETTVTLIGYKDYLASEPATVTITTASDEDCNPGFIGRFSAGAMPSKTLIKGEAYALYWTSSDIADVRMDAVSVELEQEWEDSEIYYANNTTYGFTLLDTQDPAFTDDTHSLSITANTFTVAAQSALASGVSKVLPGEDASVAYIITGSKVVKATEYLSVFEDVLDTSAMSLAESTLTGYAVTSNGKTFVSTEHYVYQIDGTTAKKIVDFNGAPDGYVFTFLHADGENVIVGSGASLLKLDTAGDCDDGDGDSNDNDGVKQNDVCILQINLEGDIIGGKTSIDETGDYQQIFKKYGTNSGSDTVFLVTAGGVYKSTNGGASFDTKVSDITNVRGGSWLGSSGGYIWTNSTVYDYQNGSFDTAVEGLTAQMTGGEIYYVNSYGSRLFVATKNGVYVKNSVGWSKDAVLTSAVPFLTFKNSVSTTAGSGTALKTIKIMPLTLGGTEYTAVLLTDTGSTATVSYKSGGFLSGILNLNF